MNFYIRSLSLGCKLNQIESESIVAKFTTAGFKIAKPGEGIPDGKVVGLSKLARTVEVFARRLQLQEQLTGQIADALMEYMQPKGALVMVEAEHMCMTMRGIKKPGSRTVTMAKRGVFESDPALEERFFRLMNAGTEK